MKSPHLTSDLF